VCREKRNHSLPSFSEGCVAPVGQPRNVTTVDPRPFGTVQRIITKFMTFPQIAVSSGRAGHDRAMQEGKTIIRKKE
jgi:hypothetical protein